MTTKTKDLTIQRPVNIPAAMIVIADDVLKEKNKLVRTAKAYGEITEKSHKEASELFESIHETNKVFKKSQKDATSPVEAFKKSIIALVKPHVEELDTVKRELGEKIHAYESEVARKAEEERKRLEEEARQREAEIEAERLKKEQEALAQGEFPEAAEEEPPALEPVPVSTPVIKSKVKVKKHWKLTVDNPLLIPHGIVDNDGNKFTLLVPDEVAIKAAFKAGIEVPGCTWKQEKSVGA